MMKLHSAVVTTLSLFLMCSVRAEDDPHPQSFLRKLTPQSTEGEVLLCDSLWGFDSFLYTTPVLTSSGLKSCSDFAPQVYGFDFDTESIVVKSTDTSGAIDIYFTTFNFRMLNGARAAIAGPTSDFDNIECGPTDERSYVLTYQRFNTFQRNTYCIRTWEGNYAKMAFKAGPPYAQLHRYVVYTNEPPVCPDLIASDAWIPPNGSMVPVSLVGVPSDPDGDDLSIEITSCKSSDPHRPKKGMDCELTTESGEEVLSVRAKRFGNSDGRLYKIGYTATDAEGLACTGEAFVCIPHDDSIGDGAVDGVTEIDAEELYWEAEAKPNGKIKRVCPDPKEVEQWYEQLV